MAQPSGLGRAVGAFVARLFFDAQHNWNTAEKRAACKTDTRHRPAVSRASIHSMLSLAPIRHVQDIPKMAKIQVSELDSPQPTSTDEEQPPHSAAPKRTLSFPALSLERLAAFDATDADTSAAPTPGLVESGKQLKRNLSFKVLREADATWVKRTLWRPGEDAASPKRRPQDLDQLIAWSVSCLVSFSL